MTTYTWTGANGADWSIAGDWTPSGGPPGAADTAFVLAGGTVTIGEAQSIDVLSIAAGALLSSSVFGPLTVTGAIQNDGVLGISAQLVVSASRVTISGSGTLELEGGGGGFITALAAGEALDNDGGTIAGF